MPRALEPGSPIEIVLTDDAQKPRESQPRLLYRALNGREFRQLLALYEKTATSHVEQLDSMYDAARVGLTGWENMNGHEFAAEDLDLILGPSEVGEVVQAVIAANTVGPEDKKKSESQP